MQNLNEQLLKQFSFDPLSKNLVLYKPLQTDAYDQSIIYELEKVKQLLIARKRDGWKLFAVVHKGKVKIYTDGMNEVDGRLDHIKKELESLKLPNKTVLVGEGIMDLNGSDSRPKVISVFGSGLEKSLEIQRQLGFAKMMFFDVVFYGGKYMLSEPYFERLELLKKILNRKSLQYLILEQILEMSYEDAKKLVIKMGWEGLVLYDKNFTSSFRLDGKSPARPKGCYKWKPIYEDDFIVRGWLPTREDPNKFKEVRLLQIDPKTGKEFDCGKFGSFSKQVKERLLTGEYPIVMQVKFEGRYESGKLINPVFVEIRTDKKADHCVSPKSFAPAQ